MNKETLVLDQKAKALSKDYLRSEAALLAHLMEMRRKRVFVELNCSGIFDYCHNVLKLSRAQSYYFKNVAETSEKVPELKTAVTTGELSLSQARRITPVITPQNHAHWINEAKKLPQAELEKKVTEVNPSARPREKIKPIAKDLSHLNVTINNDTEMDLLALKEIVSQKLGRNAALSDVVAFAARETRKKYDPEQKAKRAQNSKSVSSGNSPVKSSHDIAQSVKHEVVKREGFQCSQRGPDGKRCQAKRWLHFHHLKSVASGGKNTADNLTLLCSAHHRALHNGRIKAGPTGNPTPQSHATL